MIENLEQLNDEPPTLLFVYGTLKRGYCRHFALTGEQELGEVRTAPRYRMLNLGSYPGLVEVAEGGRSIMGELWLASSECMVRLDEIEGVSEGLYCRRRVELTIPRSEPVEAYFYLGSVINCPDCGDRWT